MVKRVSVPAATLSPQHTTAQLGGGGVLFPGCSQEWQHRTATLFAASRTLVREGRTRSPPLPGRPTLAPTKRQARKLQAWEGCLAGDLLFDPTIVLGAATSGTAGGKEPPSGWTLSVSQLRSRWGPGCLPPPPPWQGSSFSTLLTEFQAPCKVVQPHTAALVGSLKGEELGRWRRNMCT